MTISEPTATNTPYSWLNFGIDSCKLRIPLELVREYPQAINDRVLHISDTTGELYKTVDQKSTSIHTHLENVHFLAGVEMMHTSGKFNHYKQPFLTLKITSKLLGTGYFKGITKNTVEAIYRAIIDSGFDISKADFLRAELTDTDFKADIPKDWVSSKTLKSLNAAILQSAKGYKQIKKHDCSFKSKNTGIWFSKREKATTTFPYIKIYDKSKELLSKSKEFHHSHLSGHDIEYWRLEYTIKGKKMFDKYELPNTLNDILEVDNETITNIATRIWNAYMRNYRNTNIQTKSNTLETAVLKRLIPRLADEGYTQNQIIEDLISDTDNSHSRRLWTEKIEAILSGINRSDILTKERLETNENVAYAMRLFAMV